MVSAGDAGQTQASLFATQATDKDGTIGGFALAEINADPVTEGIRQVDTDRGGSFLPLDNLDFVALDNALVVPSDIIVRFVPVADFSHTPGALTVFALDDTYAGGLSPADGLIFNDTASGGNPTFLSANGGDVTTPVNPVNDAPAIAGTVLLTEGDEILCFLAPADFAPAGDTATPGGLTVCALDDTYVGGFLANGSVITIDTSTNGRDTAISESTAQIDAPIVSIINPP